ncbi:MAG: TonB family protein [Bacteroidota bacterium]|nr:TonB family protein [Bacteroidota bacterium]
MTRHALLCSLFRLAFVLLCSGFLFEQSFGQQVNQRRPSENDYHDLFIPLKGKPFHGKILRIEGKQFYVEVLKRGVPIVITQAADSLLEVKRDYGAIQISVWRRTRTAPQTQKTTEHNVAIRIPENYGSAGKGDTTLVKQYEKDSLDVGFINKGDSAQAVTFTSNQAQGEKPPALSQRPIPLIQVSPTLPRYMIENPMTGVVDVRVWIDKEGKPEKYEILSATNEAFVEPVSKAIMQWEFSPAQIHGVPIGVWASVEFEFRIGK